MCVRVEALGKLGELLRVRVGLRSPLPRLLLQLSPELHDLELQQVVGAVPLGNLLGEHCHVLLRADGGSCLSTLQSARTRS